jgi:hypothetical protein
MLRLVSPVTQPTSERRRELLIDDETYHAMRSTGWSLWRAAYSRAAVMSRRSR